MPRKNLFCSKKVVSKYDQEIMAIVGNGKVTFEHINKRLSLSGLKASCLSGIIERMISGGYIMEDRYSGLISKGQRKNCFIPCLGCGNMFESEGIHNRMCKNCKERS